MDYQEQNLQKPVVCFSHLTFLKCAHYETHVLPQNTYTCLKHQYLFDEVRQKLEHQCQKPVDRCSKTNDICFYNFVSKKMRNAGLFDFKLHREENNECQGVCFYKYLSALMAAFGNETLVYARNPYISLRNNIQSLTEQLKKSERPLVCWEHLKFLKKVNQYIITSNNECELHQCLFDNLKNVLSKRCNITYSACDESCFFVHVLDLMDPENLARGDNFCDNNKCFNTFLCNTVAEHVSGTLVYSTKHSCHNHMRSDQTQRLSQVYTLPEHTQVHVNERPPCRTPVCWDHLMFLKCMNQVTTGRSKDTCYCEVHSDFFERVKLQLTGRALPLNKCSSNCFFDRTVSELMEEESDKCPSDCFLQFTISLVEEDAEKTLEYPMSQRYLHRVKARKC